MSSLLLFMSDNPHPATFRTYNQKVHLKVTQMLKARLSRFSSNIYSSSQVLSHTSHALVIGQAAAMELFYFVVFGALGAVVAALELSKTSKDRINTSPAFNSFKNNYLLVYSLMMGN
ncbi:molybdate-anion transporter-like [Gossypium australe]|uniref:Molybdate-anion transporter-like n=1 Tax=Gossypium australe TaxID=47621 RepID=A0A5B6VLW6_9ROSI|nr:molybdate-anion transporter-like [Gossypium australe]